MSNDYITKNQFFTALAALARAAAWYSPTKRQEELHAVADTFMVAASPSTEEPVNIPTVVDVEAKTVEELTSKPVLRKDAPDAEPPTTREIVSTTFRIGVADVPLTMRLRRCGPGDVVLETFAGQLADGSLVRSIATIPWDNLVKMCVRLDPDHASEAQRQVADAREKMGVAQAEVYDKEAQIIQLKAQLAQARARITQLETPLSTPTSFQRSLDQAYKSCPGDCSRGGEGPACGLPGCKG